MIQNNRGCNNQPTLTLSRNIGNMSEGKLKGVYYERTINETEQTN
jgi:hypothetical protein